MFFVFEITTFEHIAEISLKKWREYVWSAVNVFPDSPEISDLTNRYVFQLNVCWINENIG